VQPILVFDLDDTLYPEREFVASGFNAVGRVLDAQYGIPQATDILFQVQKEGFAGRIFDETLSRLGIAHSPDYIQYLIRLYREHQPDIRLHPDAACILPQLKGRVGLAMISDGWEFTQRRKLCALKIEDLFSPAIFTFDLGKEWHKPSRRAFDCVANILGGSCQRYAYVADNPAKDFSGAAAAGWRTIHIVRPNRIHNELSAAETRADHRVSDLRELIPLIDKQE
jgi:putative hydrolase of the HAD superfamily